jgi:hypothetical protein
VSVEAGSPPVRGGELQLTTEEVAAFRLHRHHLFARARRTELVRVVGDIGGAQAQVPSAAELSIWARVHGLGPGDVADALWRERSLTKAWCMRRTLYLLPSSDLAVFVRGSARRADREVRWMRRQGISEGRLASLLDAVLASLDRPVSREEIARRVSRRLGLPMRWGPGGGWGSERKVPGVKLGSLVCPAGYLLHLAGARGVLCSGPPEGGEPTFVRAEAWLGDDWQDRIQPRAEEELLRRYLRSFGPATDRDFAAWTQMTVADARRIWVRLEGDLAAVDGGGRPAWVLREDLPTLRDSATEEESVRLLPYFDTFLLGHPRRDDLVDASPYRRVYRPAGWVAPTLLVNGQVRGVWRHGRKAPGERLPLRVETFGPLSRSESSGLAAEAKGLAEFLGARGVDLDVRRAG